MSWLSSSCFPPRMIRNPHDDHPKREASTQGQVLRCCSMRVQHMPQSPTKARTNQSIQWCKVVFHPFEANSVHSVRSPFLSQQGSLTGMVKFGNVACSLFAYEVNVKLVALMVFLREFAFALVTSSTSLASNLNCVLKSSCSSLSMNQCVKYPTTPALANNTTKTNALEQMTHRLSVSPTLAVDLSGADSCAGFS